MNLLKIFWKNFKEYKSTGAVIITAAAYWFNANEQIVPKAYADLAMTLVTVFVGTFLVGKVKS